MSRILDRRRDRVPGARPDEGFIIGIADDAGADRRARSAFQIFAATRRRSRRSPVRRHRSHGRAVRRDRGGGRGAQRQGGRRRRRGPARTFCRTRIELGGPIAEPTYASSCRSGSGASELFAFVEIPADVLDVADDRGPTDRLLHRDAVVRRAADWLETTI